MLNLEERVRETSTTTGTGTYTLAGAPSGFRPFSVLSANDFCTYVATNATPDANFEVGLGQYLTGPARLSRIQIIASSNGGAAVNWTTGTRNIRITPLGMFNTFRSLSCNVASADYTMTQYEAMRYQLIIGNGTIGVNRVIQIPAGITGRWKVRNDCLQAGWISPTLSFKTVGGNGVVIPPGTTKEVYSDGTHCYSAQVGMVKYGSFTRDVSLASGNQAVTGVGFKSSCITFYAAMIWTGATTAWSIGENVGGNRACLLSYHVESADSMIGSFAWSVYLAVSASGNHYAGALSTMDDDGFTMAWTKFGSPTGTATVVYVARQL